jgi:4-hydroxy-tetrahydrodipicolinate synthase
MTDPDRVADLRPDLKTVAAGVLTPFDEGADDVLRGELERYAEHLYDAGVRLFLASANISEYHALSHGERIASVETVVDALPADACVLGGAGDSTDEARSLAAGYEAAGADGVMVMPPTHQFVHERGLLDYYRGIADATALPLIPYVRGMEPTPETIAETAGLPSVAGIKYALHDVERFARAHAAADDDCVWMEGMAEPMAPALWAEGIEGFSSGVGNFRPEITLALLDALRDGDWARARELRNVCLPFQRLRGEAGAGNTIAGGVSVPAVKVGLEMAGLHGGPVREPLAELSDEDEQRARDLYRDIEAFVEVEGL